MASGKYGAISGMLGRMQMMENISEQLASVKVHGYKKGTPTFRAELAEAQSGLATKGTNYARVSGETIDFTPGQLEYTGDPLHVAIDGDGFFQVQQPDGGLAYARKGRFQLSPEGILLDSHGRQVQSAGGGALVLPSPEVDITQDGNIWHQGVQVGQLGVYRFEDNAVLRRAPQGSFLADAEVQPELHPTPSLQQRNLESSNVDTLQTMVRMTANLRAFEATQKALRIYSEMGDQLNELGSLQ